MYFFCQRWIIDALEAEVETTLIERIRDMANTERYDRMIVKWEEQIVQAKKLTTRMLNELIVHIEVHQAEKIDGK